ncbi:hypothetical protein EGI31_19565 [Lacihabitans soyangensis]|uniref:TET-Associated Glycosyltransferase domain-containing protein n=2 Tax=Lacihabitans soyangensis TaxID=869394 RepID=A0AAE3H5I1_9BACT|nr:hypothetical protein [Lacihabitans soyangensis]
MTAPQPPVGEIKVLIASHKRADKITTHKKVANSIICIPESQLGEYREHCPDAEIVTHPDSIIGLSWKRQWMYEYFGDAFHMDDDLMYMKRIYTETGEKDKLSPQEIFDVIQATARAARQSGAFLFGFNTSGKPFTYASLAPIQLSGYVNTCAFGLLEGSKLYFRPEQRYQEDYWICGLNAYLHRKIWRDNRFYFHYGDTWVGSGGLAEFRNMETLEKILGELQGFFGEYVICVRKTGTRNHQFQMNFKVPF